MPTQTVSQGVTLTIPTAGTRNWASTFLTFTQALSSHDHTGSGKGLQISTSGLANFAVTEAKFRLTNNNWVVGRNAANSANVNLFKLNASDALEFAQPISGAPGTDPTDYVQLEQVQNDLYRYGGQSSGASNTYEIGLTPALTAYETGQKFRYLAHQDNAGASTLNIDGVAAANLKKFNPITNLNVDLIAGDVNNGQMCEVIHYSPDFVLMNPATLPSSAITVVQNSTYTWGGTSTGASNVYAFAVTPAATAYATGQAFKFLAHQTNTGAATGNLNSIASKNIKKKVPQTEIYVDLVAGDIRINQIVEVVYDGTSLVLQNPMEPLYATWVPTLAVPVGTFDSPSIESARYKINATEITFQVKFTGTPSDDIDYFSFTLPVAPQWTFGGGCSVEVNALLPESAPFLWSAGAQVIRVYRGPTGTWANSQALTATVSGTYELFVS